MFWADVIAADGNESMAGLPGDGEQVRAAAGGPVPTGRPRWICDDGRVVPIETVPLGGRDVREDDLQRLLDRHPDLLPIDEIGAAWGPLVSLGREIGLDRGFVDNLFVSPTGELTVVEAKLWRNPEARRKVVGQILDYAAALATLSYEDLDGIVVDAGGDDRRTIWQRVCGAVLPPPSEHRFVDVVSRNLRAGRFLLLVVGDGIRSDLRGIADLLGAHPSLGFHLELVELRLYRMPDGSRLVVPDVVGRTVEQVTRAVVQVASRPGVNVVIEVEQPEVAPRPGARARYASVDKFLADFEEATDVERAKAVGELLTWWRRERGSVVKLSKTSVNLSVPFAYRPGGGVSVMTIYAKGWAQGSVAPMVEWREIVPLDEALPPFVAAGFDASDEMWPRLTDFDLTQPDTRARIERLLTWADDRIRGAEHE
jgi:hypothetical protein